MTTVMRELLLEEVKGNQSVAFQLLEAEQPLFVNQKVAIDGENLQLELVQPDGSYAWGRLVEMTREEQLRHFINLGQVFELLNQTVYTYDFHPSKVLFTLNALPLLIERGVKGQVPPYEALTVEEFLTRYQAMMVSVLDKKTSYDTLINGKLPFYRGNLFCEQLVKADSLADVSTLLQAEYQTEKEKNKQTMTVVTKSRLARLKATSILAGLGAVLLAAGLGYVLLSSLPKQEMISQTRLAFIQKDYSKVVTTVKAADSKVLSQDDKYIVALSVIMTEPLTETQRQELSKISTQSNEDYLRYWILIGQSKIDEAIDIASFLDDPQLLMYGMTKKIDDIQRDPNLTAEERTSQLNTYKTKLDELKKTYLTPEETAGAASEETPASSGQE
ncbi:type VII secretion protein EssB [Streptococcus pluranimalium]|uniref:type VII secretion protein EssB n=1 Tax=Streptococcus pluranimalium TaxID=82348 RepID=UPI0039FBA643